MKKSIMDRLKDNANDALKFICDNSAKKTFTGTALLTVTALAVTCVTASPVALAATMAIGYGGVGTSGMLKATEQVAKKMAPDWWNKNMVKVEPDISNEIAQDYMNTSGLKNEGPLAIEPNPNNSMRDFLIALDIINERSSDLTGEMKNTLLEKVIGPKAKLAAEQNPHASEKIYKLLGLEQVSDDEIALEKSQEAVVDYKDDGMALG